MNTQHSRQRHPGQGDWQERDARDHGDERQGRWQRSEQDVETGSRRWDEDVEGAHGRDRGSSYHDGGRDDRGSFGGRAMGTQGAREEGRFMPGGRDFGGSMYGESRGTRHESEQARSYHHGHDFGYRGYAEDTPGSGQRNNLSTRSGERGEGFRGDYDREYTRNNSRDHGWNDRGSGQNAYGARDGNQRGMQPRSEWIGKGPKGYTRSPERIREQVSELLSQGYLDASDIEVAVSGDTVTLSGTVADRQTKRLAEQIVESCSWVGDVENKLRIGGRDNLSSRDPRETGSSAASSKRASA